MKRYLSISLLALVTAVPLVAQAPKGWMVRADRSTNASDPDAAGAVKFVTMGSGFHATNPQAAVFWNPGPQQSYLYFVVAQDGTWLIKRRDGDASTQNVAAKSPSDAVKKPDASGQSINALEVRVSADKIDYLVNGTVVHSTPKTGLTAKTDGIYGIRVNHQLEVHVEGLAATKQ